MEISLELEFSILATIVIAINIDLQVKCTASKIWCGYLYYIIYVIILQAKV